MNDSASRTIAYASVGGAIAGSKVAGLDLVGEQFLDQGDHARLDRAGARDQDAQRALLLLGQQHTEPPGARHLAVEAVEALQQGASAHRPGSDA